MSRYPGKKLPPNWVYIPSPREVRAMLGDLAADVRRVDFDGTGSGLSRFGHLSIGYLERRVVDGVWCFYLRFWGVPETIAGDRRGELSRAAIDAITRSTAECLAVPAAEVIKPTQLLLAFRVDSVGVALQCRVKPVDGYTFSAGSWWTNPGRD